MQISTSNPHLELTPEGFSALLNAAADAIIIIDHNARILNINLAAQRLFQYQPIELEGKNVNTLMPEPYKTEHDGYLANYLRTGEQKVIGIGRRVEAKKKDGEVFPMELSVGEYSSDGEILFVGIIRDLTEKERVSEALKKSEQQLSETEQALLVTLENAPIGIITLELDGTVISMNHSAIVLTGYSRSEVVGRNFKSILHKDDLQRIEQHRLELLENKASSFSLNARYLRKNESIAHATLHCSLVNPGSPEKKQLLIAQLVDRTDQIKAEQEASGFREKLAHVDRVSTMGEMASGIAHEINQPLSAISSYVQACLRRLNSGNLESEKLQELLEKTDKQAQRAGTVVQRIRSLIRKHDRIRERVEINKIVEDTISLVQADTRSRGMLVEVELMPEIREVIVDSVQIQQVILNLVRNAIDATEDVSQIPVKDSGISVGKIRIGTQDSSHPDQVEIWVQDFGHGIADELKDKLFESFITSKKSGTGMGLSISRSIVDAHGGKIRVESSPTDTTFFITLPTAVGQ